MYLHMCVFLHTESEVNLRFCSSGAITLFLRQGLINLELMASAEMTAVSSRDHLLPLQRRGQVSVATSGFLYGCWEPTSGPLWVCTVLAEHLHPTAHAALFYLLASPTVLMLSLYLSQAERGNTGDG